MFSFFRMTVPQRKTNFALVFTPRYISKLEFKILLLQRYSVSAKTWCAWHSVETGIALQDGFSACHSIMAGWGPLWSLPKPCLGGHRDLEGPSSNCNPQSQNLWDNDKRESMYLWQCLSTEKYTWETSQNQDHCPQYPRWASRPKEFCASMKRANLNEK